MTLLDRIFCKQQLDRMSGLPGFPRKGEAEAAMLDAFQKAFTTEHQVRQCIDDWLRTERRCPVPADVWDAGRSVNPKRDRRSGAPSCTTCYDRGTVPGWFLWTWSRDGVTKEPITEEQRLVLVPKIGRNQRLYEFPVPCRCRGGNPDAKWGGGAWPVPTRDGCAKDYHCDGFSTPVESTDWLRRTVSNGTGE